MKGPQRFGQLRRLISIAIDLRGGQRPAQISMRQQRQQKCTHELSLRQPDWVRWFSRLERENVHENWAGPVEQDIERRGIFQQKAAVTASLTKIQTQMRRRPPLRRRPLPRIRREERDAGDGSVAPLRAFFNRSRHHLPGGLPLLGQRGAEKFNASSAPDRWTCRSTSVGREFNITGRVAKCACGNYRHSGGLRRIWVVGDSGSGRSVLRGTESKEFADLLPEIKSNTREGRPDDLERQQARPRISVRMRRSQRQQQAG